MSSPLRTHAELYHKMGFALLPVHFPRKENGAFVCSCGKNPCNSIGKHPMGKLVPNGVKDASKDWTVIKGWIAAYPLGNIGIATGAVSGIFALDIDPRHGGKENLDHLERRHGFFPAEAVRFHTGGGGEHILFKHPGINIPNLVGRLAAGIDIRGDGGYIVAPPSTHVSGRSYAIDVDDHPEYCAIPEAPAWLLEKISGKPLDPERRITDWRELTRKGAATGERNDSIARLAGHLLRNRIDPWVTAELLFAWNAQRCKPPLSESEVMATLCSIAGREIARRKGDDHEF